MRVIEVSNGGTDAGGNKIDEIYAKNPPDYAVYRSQGQVIVHLADDPDRAKAQTVAMAPLSVLRGAISRLVDNWRNDAGRESKILQVDRGVADALSVGLQGDITSARGALEQIRSDIMGECTSVARFDYLRVGTICAVLVLLVTLGLTKLIAGALYPTADKGAIITALGGGTIGAFFSIATGLRSRTVRPDLRYRDNAADAILRVLIGTIGAGVALALYRLGLLTGFGMATPGRPPAAPDAGPDTIVFLIGFVAGFSERMVPDLLTRNALGASAVAAATGAGQITQASANAASQLSRPAEPAAARPAAASEADAQDGCPSDASPETGEAVTEDAQLPPAQGGLGPAGAGPTQAATAS